MDEIYYGGVVCIQYLQETFKGSEHTIQWINDTADPHLSLVYIFPFIAMLDAAFASQYLLVMAGGEWLNAVLKWLTADDRPYWWVQETDYFAGEPRPKLLQTRQTCETGPGCPSGHVMSAMSHVVLLSMWISHVVADRTKGRVPKWITWPMWPLMLTAVGAVAIARLVVATHFPHQVLFGALQGFFMAPLLTIYVSDGYIWGRHNLDIREDEIRHKRIKHVLMALSTTVAGFGIYWGMKAVGIDPQWSVKLAFKWCEDVHSIKVSTTPLFSLVESCGSLLGWAVFVTPAVARYRYFTKGRTLAIAAPSMFLAFYAFATLQRMIPSESAVVYYVLNFAVYMLQPLVYLTFVPFLATLPWRLSTPREKRD